MKFPKTPKGLLHEIERTRNYLTACKRTYGWIDDGGGSRYYLFYLYFLLGDNRRSSHYFRWFRTQFPDDAGEPLALLCWALMLNRMGKNGDCLLAETMLSNIYLIPHLIGEELPPSDLYFYSNYEEPSLLTYLPDRVLDAISEDDRGWMAERYSSDRFQIVLKRHMEITRRLAHTPVGKERTDLVEEKSTLLNEMRKASGLPQRLPTRHRFPEE